MARIVRSRLVIGGKEYPHRDLRVGQELAGDMPDAVAATGGFPQTEGSAQIWVGPSVSSRAPSPFSGYGGTVPADGTPVMAYVDAGDGQGEQIIFRGKIDGTSGKASDGWVHVDLIDSIDQMRATFTLAGLMNQMPPVWEGEDAFRYPLPTPLGVIHAALQSAGFNATPPWREGVLWELSGQGRVYSSTGLTTLIQSPTSGRLQPRFTPAPWGQGISDARVIGRTNEEINPWPTGGNAILVNFLVGPGHAADTVFKILQKTGNANSIITITSNRVVRVQVDSSPVLSLPLGEAQRVSIRLTPTGSEIRTENGGFINDSNVKFGARSLQQFDLTAGDGACLAGLQVMDGWKVAGHPILNYEMTARFRPGAFISNTQASRNIRYRSAREVLDEVCKATLTALWIDRAGVVQVAGSDVLHSQAPVKKYSTSTDIRGLAWESATRYARRAVEVLFTPWTVKLSKETSIQVWQGDGAQMATGQTISQFIEIPADQVWLNVDHAFTDATHPQLSSGNLALINRGIGSVLGTAVDGGSGGSISDMAAAAQSMRYMGLWQYLYTAQATKDCKQAIGDEAKFASTVRGQSTPILRARGYAETTASQSERREGGPGYAPELAHDMGVWGSLISAAAMADWLKSMVFKPRPVFNGFDVPLDPSLEVGQVIDVESLNLLGVTVRGLVVSRDHNVSDAVTTVSIRVIDVIANRGTYQDLETAWAGRDYAALETAFSGDTYTGFENYPTKGAPNGV